MTGGGEALRGTPGSRQNRRARLVFSDGLTRYDFGSFHPMGPGRVRSAISLARALGVLDQLDRVDPSPADDQLLRRVHSDAYIAAVQAAEPNPIFGLGTEDNPVFPYMHEVSSQIVTASVDAARSVWQGEALRAVNIAGGLHHAMPSAASGFCIYNDLAIAIHWLLEQGCERIAYVDVDVHHGDGVQTIFYDDPRVLTISLHETPVKLFPGTGYPHETGGPDAAGSAVNVALPAGTDDRGWLRAFDAVVPEALAAFKPTILVTQHGCDSHYSDPLADLRLSVDGQRASYLALARLADELTQGRWIAGGGGGYSLVDVVPRAWAHLLAIVAGTPIPPPTSIPQLWRDEAGDGAPMSMTDGGSTDFTPVTAGIDPASRLDQAILATRRAVFPDLGLDPGF
ncbi:acetoin utilization protein AcuC [Microlunatus endophyticus]|uniref:Acetoin utilization protein AcuC n=1 Tax=Microlunatus endophyticus TaxID=1716077 RepID=A0A917S6V2_9ACTN|nr:acetoin utilization protein AcuC [Microlunatus endophyticus]GGL58956.1 acetoin utilization protein AcuC [Microlunatus endophyticus]